MHTVTSPLLSFFLAMMLYPESQILAHQELDSIVGADRSPVFSDRLDLPYITALVREILRWHPPSPLGLTSHCVIEDDQYLGYSIPKRSAVISNIWAMSRDQSIYDSPELFNPGRFLSDGKLNKLYHDSDYLFGFGRR
ncbi:cytochrome P450 [Rhodocollybia butyracea]|uniref:Cytochrome P450 n=1 Tax=Rhodocollybia butyracea TaxID=206335 RepID=A0A9P5P6D2_9AGAR|nr:cytochrome P450 [Rhodocollybia butyracea]